jgi:hypothetical protein
VPVTPSIPDRSPRFALRRIAAGVGMGLLIALATSAGIAGERITQGALGVALCANAATTAVALLVLFLMVRGEPIFSVAHGGNQRGRTARFHRLTVFAPQVCGAVLGVLLVHLLLRREALGILPWLSERPAQLVNDTVAVAGFLVLVWASAGGLDARLLVLAFVGVTLYRVTSPMWHLDHAPGGFHTSVQELVVAQFVGAALAVGLFRTALVRADR